MRQKDQIEILPGQLSIWDVVFTEKPNKIIKSLKEIKENKNDKPIKPLKLTDKQKEFLNKNQVMKNENLSRIIKYCGGGLGIEIKHNKSYSTIYVNAAGKKEFEFKNKSRVLPMDKIIYYNEDMKANDLQKKKLKEVMQSENIKRGVRRKGDENILVECEEKVISINSKGWKLEFNSISKVECSENEILEIGPEEVDSGSLEKAQNKIHIGSVIEIVIKGKKTLAKVFSIYNNGDTLSILFDNDTKHTAVHKSCISKIIA
jgi:hypothetical protein